MRNKIVSDKYLKYLLVFLLMVFASACGSHLHEHDSPKIVAPLKPDEKCKNITNAPQKYIEGCELLVAIADMKWKIDHSSTAKVFKKGDIFKLYAGNLSSLMTENQSASLEYIEHKKAWYNLTGRKRYLSVDAPKKITVTYTDEKASVSIGTSFFSVGKKFHRHPVSLIFTKENEKYLVTYKVLGDIYNVDGSSFAQLTHRDSGTGTAQ